MLRGFLERVDELVEPDCDLPCLVADCEKYTVRGPERFRTILKVLLRTPRGWRLWH